MSPWHSFDTIFVLVFPNHLQVFLPSTPGKLLALLLAELFVHSRKPWPGQHQIKLTSNTSMGILAIND